MKHRGPAVANFLKTLFETASNLAKAKALVDAETGDFGRDVADTLSEAQASVDHSIDLFIRVQGQVREYEVQREEEEGRQLTMTFDRGEEAGDEGLHDNAGDGEESAPGAGEVLHYAVWMNSDNQDRFAVRIGRAEDLSQEVTGYVPIAEGGDAPERDALASLIYSTDPGNLAYLNDQLAGWAELESTADATDAQNVTDIKNGARKRSHKKK